MIEALPRLLTRGVPAEIAAVARRTATSPKASASTSTPASRRSSPTACASPTARLVAGRSRRRRHRRGPQVELAAEAGLAVDNGIAVDATLATADPAIFAAGDCCSFPLPLYDGRRVRLESWRSAQEQGSLAARNMLGAAEPVAAVPWFWSDQYDLTLQIAGLAEGASTEVRRDLATAPSSSSTSPPTAASSPPPASAPATPSPRTSASPRC